MLDPNPDVAEVMKYSGVRRPPPPLIGPRIVRPQVEPARSALSSKLVTWLVVAVAVVLLLAAVFLPWVFL